MIRAPGTPGAPPELPSLELPAPELPPLELWGGVECTIVRIGDGYRDEVVETGHHRRLADLDAVAALGIRTLRYPVLWESVSPEDPAAADWRWHDERLGRLRELGITPIAGLLHHGSGPRYTSLLDPGFAAGLARHAERVAARYPWLELFTPVNEPLTTARFSGLYGHWYPHGRDYPTFLRALVNQCTGICLAMQAIRRVTPAARLVQTEDLGRTFSTARLRYQADHENERRWLSLDLLCGRVDRTHPWHARLLGAGIGEQELALFLGGAATPDVIGINHYLTSDRYLDQHLARYPAAHHGGNGRDHYADVEAVRMPLPARDIGPKARLGEAWRRYGLPIAVTEAHHGCTREEQTRWLCEIWQAADQLRHEGADIRAVTIWSLFGAVDWQSLLTRRAGVYEPGAFDVRSDPPRPTALARAAAGLARTGRFDHAILESPGWWHRADRFYRPRRARPRARPVRTLLVTGGAGSLGRTIEQVCRVRGLEAVVLQRRDLDVTDAAATEQALSHARPWAVVNAAGRPPTSGPAAGDWRDNVDGAEVLARACAAFGIPLVTFSSDRVFDGAAGRPYVESDPIAPDDAFGESKAEAERRVAEVHAEALIIRSGPFLGDGDDRSFLFAALSRLRAGEEVALSDSGLVSPAYLPDLVNATLDLLLDEERGVWHVTGDGADSPLEFTRRAARAAGVDETALVGRSGGRMRALSSERGMLLPPLASAIERWATRQHPM